MALAGSFQHLASYPNTDRRGHFCNCTVQLVCAGLGALMDTLLKWVKWVPSLPQLHQDITTMGCRQGAVLSQGCHLQCFLLWNQDWHPPRLQQLQEALCTISVSHSFPTHWCLLYNLRPICFRRLWKWGRGSLNYGCCGNHNFEFLDICPMTISTLTLH